MNIQTLISDVDTLCDNESAAATTGHLANVRYILENLATYVARREQAIEARTSGEVDVALGIETRADAHMTQLAIDGEAMIRPVQPVKITTRRLPRIEDAPVAELPGVVYLQGLEQWSRDND